MKLSTKGRYGLRALVDLALHGETEAVSISSIAQRQTISERYLEQLIAKLKKAGIVESIRGPQGGYVLSKKPDSISIGEILRALEGDLNAVDCPAGNCSSSGLCATKSVWKKINDAINRAVDDFYLSDLLQEYKDTGMQAAIDAKKEPFKCIGGDINE